MSDSDTVTKTYKTALKYLITPDEAILTLLAPQADQTVHSQQNFMLQQQNMLMEGLAAYLYQYRPSIPSVYIHGILQAAHQLVTGQHTTLLSNALDTAHQTGRFTVLWRGVIQGQVLQRGPRKGRSKAQRRHQRYHQSSTTTSLTESEYQILAQVLVKTVQKHAVVQRIQELCREATTDALYYAPKVTLLREAGMVTARQQNQTSKELFDWRKMEVTIPTARKKVVGTLQELLGDKRTILESVFTTLDVVAQNYCLWQQRLEDDVQPFFQDYNANPTQWASYLLFGDRTQVSNYLSSKWGVTQRWVHNHLSGMRRLMDGHLPQHYWIYPAEHEEQLAPLALATLYPQVFQLQQFSNACQQVVKRLTDVKITRQQHKRSSWLIDQLIKKIEVLHAYHEVLLPILNDPSSPLTLGRQSIKDKAEAIENYVKQHLSVREPSFRRLTNYRSALLAILTTAAVTCDPDLQNPLNVASWLTSAHCLTPPFQTRLRELQRHQERLLTGEFSRDPLKQHLQPLLLTWKPTQLLYRPTASEITELMRTQGYFDLVLVKCAMPQFHGNNFDPSQTYVATDFRLRQTVRIPIRVTATPKMRSILTNGASIDVIRLLPPQGVNRKIVADLVFTGPPTAFCATKHLSPANLAKYSASLPVELQPTPTQALDVNRGSQFMLVFSTEPSELTEAQFSPELQAQVNHYNQTTQPLQSLESKHDRAVNKRYLRSALATMRQADLLRRRRANLLASSHYRCSVESSSQLALTQSHTFLIEALDVDTAGTQGALAKAILTMPDDPEIYVRAVANVFAAFHRECRLVQLPLDGTSLIHVGCGGTLQRTRDQWDYAPCDRCDEVVCTHRNAAEQLNHRYCQPRGLPQIKARLKPLPAPPP